MDIQELKLLMDKAGNNINIVNAFAKTWDIIDRYRYPVCSISGGADSDIMLDIIRRFDSDKRVRYVWFNTGLEYSATKKHLNFLEEKYAINIERVNAVKSIPQCCKEYGQPFLSKLVSEMISRLQKSNFDFSDMSYDDMIANYPAAATNWWHSRYKGTLSISRYKRLKDFLIAHPPSFRISNACCNYAKKKAAKNFITDNNIDLNIIGVRKAEGGIRSMLQSCFTGDTEHGTFRPLFFFNEQDKINYCQIFGVTHSECYTKYGLKRTGCAGCPFNRAVFKELEAVKDYEAGLVKAASNIFRESYEYTKLYREFCSSSS